MVPEKRGLSPEVRVIIGVALFAVLVFLFFSWIGSQI